MAGILLYLLTGVMNCAKLRRAGISYPTLSDRIGYNNTIYSLKIMPISIIVAGGIYLNFV